MRNLIEDLTSLSYLETGLAPAGRELTDMRQLLVEVRPEIQPLIKAKSQRLHIDESEVPLPVKVDRHRMIAAVTKLLSNAASFTPESGEIRIRTFRKSDEAWIQVEDTGPGIAPGHEEEIFQPFYQLEDHLTRTHGGMGLGLSIARGTVELHGGRLWAENVEPGPGSRFTVALPLATPN